MRIGASAALLAIVTEGLVSRLSFGIIAFALPLYAHHLGFSVAEIGVLLSLNFAASLVLKPAMGRLADRRGFKLCLVSALALRALVSLGLALAWLPWQLYALRIAHGASRALRDPAAYAIIAERSAKQALASSYAWYGSIKSVAGTLGHALAGLLLAATLQDFSLVFAIAACLAVVPVFVVWRFVPSARPGEAAREPAANAERRQSAGGPSSAPSSAPASATSRAPGRWRRFLPVMGFGFLMSGCGKMIGGLFPLLAVEYAGLTEAQTGLIYGLAALVMLVAGPAFGWLSDNVSRDLVLMVRSVANVVSSLVFMLAPNLAGMLCGRLVDETGKAAFKPAWGAMMAEHSELDRRNRARTLAVLSVGEEAGGVLGPILAGFLWSTWGVAVMLGVRIALAALSELYATLMIRSNAAARGPRAALQPEAKRRG